MRRPFTKVPFELWLSTTSQVPWDSASTQCRLDINGSCSKTQSARGVRYDDPAFRRFLRDYQRRERRFGAVPE